MHRVNPKIPQNEIQNLKELSNSRVDEYNNSLGTLEDYDCQICKNKGYIMFDDNGYDTLKPCQCKKVRDSIRYINKSGLKKLLEYYTFDKYLAVETWQKNIKKKAQEFLSETHGNWFYIGGQVGSGKSHICTSIVNALLKLGNESLYMKWRDDSVELKKSIASDGDDYFQVINRFKNVKVLYIDDFMKTERGKLPTSADVMLAFEILNYRYNNMDLITIISTERSVDELIEIDEAIGSRIYQRSKKYCFYLSADPEKNIRLKGNL